MRADTSLPRRDRVARILLAVLIGCGLLGSVVVLLGYDGPARRPDVVASSGRGAPDPESLGELPTGAPPTVPYCLDGRLLRGAGPDIALRHGCPALVHRGGRTIGTLGERVVVPGSGRLLTVEEHALPSAEVVLSLDGSTAAWVRRADHGATLVVWDLVSGAEVASTAMPVADPRDLLPGYLAGIDDRGRVYVGSFDTRLWVYSPRRDRMREVTDVPPHLGVTNVLADGVGLLVRTWGAGGATEAATLEGRVTSDGRFLALASARPVGPAAYSPDRTLLAQHTANGIWVQETRTLWSGRRVRLQLPREGTPLGRPVWENDDALLVPYWASGAETAGQALVRCAVADGSCEVTLPLGEWVVLGGSPRWPVLR
ncbi:MAG TPA: hypothetical protein VLA97_16915 [Nocardioidaceae bacterium]|nr:hypothetical protein [Nocardioidaceae bacterium]